MCLHKFLHTTIDVWQNCQSMHEPEPSWMEEVDSACPHSCESTLGSISSISSRGKCQLYFWLHWLFLHPSMFASESSYCYFYVLLIPRVAYRWETTASWFNLIPGCTHIEHDQSNTDLSSFGGQNLNWEDSIHLKPRKSKKHRKPNGQFSRKSFSQMWLIRGTRPSGLIILRKKLMVRSDALGWHGKI